MTISFSGLASGLDTSGWVEALVSSKQDKLTTLQTELKTLQTKKGTLNDARSTVNSLRTAIEKLTDAKFGGTFDLFTKNTAKSSNTDIFTATASSGAVRQSYSIDVKQLATSTKATSKESVSAVANDATTLQALGVKDGSLAIYVDGNKKSIEIDSDETFGDLKLRLADAGVGAEIDENGILKLSALDLGSRINIGSTTDTSNLVSIFGLSKQEDGTYTSTNSLYKADISSKLTSADAGFNGMITEGTFKIGNATFTIDKNTTLSSLVSKINDSDDAQATAHWDNTTGKLSITSKVEGGSFINIEAGTSNFTDVMGFTETVRDEDGNITSSKLFTEAQELGKNALFSINGTDMISNSNTVSSDISRLTGVTITLKKVSTEETSSPTLEVNQDSTQLVDAVKSFVEAYNNTLSKIDDVTASGSDLQRESSLTSLKRTIMNYANGSNVTNGGAFKLLSEIGISTGEADSSNLSANTSELKFDEDKFNEALTNNPDSVKAILADENGILNQIENAVEMTLKASSGFFDVKQTSLDSDIRAMEEKIKKQNNYITSYKSQLEAKFSNMELMISKMQQSYSSFLTQ